MPYNIVASYLIKHKAASVKRCHGWVWRWSKEYYLPAWTLEASRGWKTPATCWAVRCAELELHSWEASRKIRYISNYVVYYLVCWVVCLLLWCLTVLCWGQRLDLFLIWNLKPKIIFNLDQQSFFQLHKPYICNLGGDRHICFFPSSFFLILLIFFVLWFLFLKFFFCREEL